MNWKLKARIQSLVARLPDVLSYPLYYQLQRQCGGLRSSRIDPTNRMQVGIDICRQVVRHGRSPVAATFLEVGTGWRLNLPIACWLCGAGRIITVDLNKYLKPELIRADLRYLRHHADKVEELFCSQAADLFDRSRWRRLLNLRPTNLAAFCRALRIEYLAPADAAALPLPSRSIDFHISCNVLEHIPTETLRDIFTEANRLVRPDGLLVHRVDHSDHFAHNDRAISLIHFLQFDEATWHGLAGNRYAYVNRLREDDYLRLFAELGQNVCRVESQADPAIANLLTSGFPLQPAYRNKSPDTLARLHSTFVAMPAADTRRQAA